MDGVIFLGASCQIVAFCLEVFGRRWLFLFIRDGHLKLFAVNMRTVHSFALFLVSFQNGETE